MTYISKIRWFVMALLAVISPFHAFIFTWLKSGPAGENAAFTVLLVWREIAVLILGILTLIEIMRKKHLPKLDLLDIFILIFTAISFVWLPFQLKNPGQWILGLRFDAMPLVFFLICRHCQWEKINKLVAATLTSALIVVVFGLVHAILLPQNFFTAFGYVQYESAFNPDIGISACQHLEDTQSICRAVSTFGGPTRYGTYLLFIAGLLLPFVIYKSKYRYYAAAFLALIALSIVLTFSRSVWVAAIATIIGVFFWLIPKKFKLKLGIVILIMAVLGIIFWQLNLSWKNQANTWPPPLLKTIFLRTTSSGEHLKLAREGLQIIFENPMGIGLGTAGPASVRFQKLLTENWYLQIGVEMGIIGLISFLGVLFLFFKKLFGDKHDLRKIGLGLGLLAIAIAGLFTHSFEETTAVLLLFGFIGIYLNASVPSSRLPDA